MKPEQIDSVVTICLMAAFCDGEKQNAEREQIKAIFESLGVANAPAIYQKVMLKQVQLSDAVTTLDTKELRQLTYELAVGVCDADDVVNELEAAFLRELRTALELTESTSSAIESSAEEIVAAPPGREVSLATTTAAEPETATPKASAEEADKTILRYAVFAAALELLPQSFATLAIIPVQVRMVYRIGAINSYDLDAGHIKEFIGAIGVGLTSQYVEGIARKFIGGWVSGLSGVASKAATGGAITFASTYGIGKVAQSYYSGGRSLDIEAMKRMFGEFSGQADGLFSKYQGAIGEQAKKIDVTKLSSLIQNE